MTVSKAYSLLERDGVVELVRGQGMRVVGRTVRERQSVDRDEVVRLIRRLHRDNNFTIVLIEHDMRVVFHLADRITVLDQGSLLAEGGPQEIAANPAVQAAYLGKAA